MCSHKMAEFGYTAFMYGVIGVNLSATLMSAELGDYAALAKFIH